MGLRMSITCSLPTNTMYKAHKVLPVVVSWTNIVSVTSVIVDFLNYKDYQSSTEVSREFVVKKKFSYFRLVTVPSTIDLLAFFAKDNNYTDINLKDCVSVTDEVVNAVIKSSALSLKSLNLDNCQSLTRIPVLNDNQVYEMSSDFHMIVKSVSSNELCFVISLEGNVRLYDGDMHESLVSPVCVLCFFITCMVHYENVYGYQIAEQFCVGDVEMEASNLLSFATQMSNGHLPLTVFGFQFTMETGIPAFIWIQTNGYESMDILFVKIPLFNGNNTNSYGWKIFDIRFFVRQIE